MRREDIYSAALREYERRKALWIREHPEATHEDYQAAMRRIAQETGI